MVALHLTSHKKKKKKSKHVNVPHLLEKGNYNLFKFGYISANMSEKREEPNILITGTPGVGKSHLCTKLAEKLNFTWHDISSIAKERNLFVDYDKEFDCPILDEDKLLDYMEPIMKNGGNIVEYHGCDFFPERWFDAVFVMRCDNTILYDRLSERKYNEKKLKSNVECEIFQTIFEEAQDSYKEEIIFELKGETLKDSVESVKKVKDWYKAWKRK